MTSQTSEKIFVRDVLEKTV